jgi:hypothetical protein
MPFPSKGQLAGVLAGQLRKADPESAVWTSYGDALKAGDQVAAKYRPDPAGRPLGVGQLTEKIAPETYHRLFVVIRVELEMSVRVGYGHLQFVTVAQGDRRHWLYENPSPKKAPAVAAALNELEADA